MDLWYTGIAFSVYLIVILGIGAYCARTHTANLTDFYLGGRNMGDWVVALSAVVSGRSSWLIVGVSGMAYAKGIAAVWAVIGYIVVELMMFLFLGRRLRRYTHMVDAITIPDFYAARFNDRGHVLRITCVVIIVVFMTFYVAAQLTAGGKTFCQSFELGDAYRLHSVFFTAAIILAYTTLGGFVAVSITDMIQAFFMIFGLVVLPAVALFHLGGLGVLFDALSQADTATLVDPWSIGVGGIIGSLGIGLGSPGNPHILVRFMSVRRAELLRRSALVGTVWNVVMAWGAIFVGLVARAQVEGGWTSAAIEADSERIFPVMAQLHLHPLLVGCMVAAVFAAIMSTIDSQLLVASSAISRDLYQKIIKRGEVDQRSMVRHGRMVVVVIIILATLLASIAIMYPEQQHVIFWFVLFAWSGLGASFGTTIIPALFWRRTSRWGVFAGLLSGTLVTIVWKSLPQLPGYELVPAFLISLVVVVLVSLVTSPPDRETLAVLDDACRFP
ncbi:MAG: sodium/proline symporter [Planctomycetota bacterium]|jgi:SSS family solute:Na+ symporter